MNITAFREHTPERTCVASYSDYTRYKRHLKKDFQSRCGYCNDIDWLSGGISVYHVDHFAPKSKFPHLAGAYSNLVYACPYCNRGKWDDWPSDQENVNIVGDIGYIDPANSEYETHFRRDNSGSIVPVTPVGNYMYRKLRLYLKRHALMWNIGRLWDLEAKLLAQVDQVKVLPQEMTLELIAVTKQLHEFIDYLQDI